MNIHNFIFCIPCCVFIWIPRFVTLELHIIEQCPFVSHAVGHDKSSVRWVSSKWNYPKKQQTRSLSLVLSLYGSGSRGWTCDGKLNRKQMTDMIFPTRQTARRRWSVRVVCDLDERPDLCSLSFRGETDWANIVRDRLGWLSHGYHVLRTARTDNYGIVNFAMKSSCDFYRRPGDAMRFAWRRRRPHMLGHLRMRTRLLCTRWLSYCLCFVGPPLAPPPHASAVAKTPITESKLDVGHLYTLSDASRFGIRDGPSRAGPF